MKSTTKWLLFMSSYVPLFIILIIYNIDLNRTINSISYIIKGNLVYILKNITFEDFYLCFLIVLSILLTLSLKLVFKENSGFHKKLRIMKIESSNNSILEYFTTYLLTFTSSEFDLRGVIAFWFILWIIGYLYIKNNMLYINPTIHLFYKYNIYKISDNNGISAILLSKLNDYEINTYYQEEVSVNLIYDSLNGNIYIL